MFFYTIQYAEESRKSLIDVCFNEDYQAVFVIILTEINCFFFISNSKIVKS